MSSKSPDSHAIALLERRLARERAARKAAETLLSSKSSEVYEALLRSSDTQRLLEMALWASGESIWEWSAEDDTYITRSFANPDLPPRVASGSLQQLAQHLHPDDRDRFWLSWRMHAAGASEPLDLAIRVSNSRRHWRWIRVRGKAVELSADGTAQRIVGTVKDITAHREAEYSFRLMASAFASSRDAMLVLRDNWQIIEANDAFQQLTGEQGLPGRALSDYLRLPDNLQQRFDDGGHAQCETRLRARSGVEVPVELTLSRFAAEDSTLSYLIATLRDITDRKRTETALERVARFDALTELPNRSSLQQQLSLQLRKVDANRQLAVLFIDLDGFKQVNDSLGHQAGDELLRIVAARLGPLLADNGLLARWGGDEFVALQRVGADREQTLQLAERLLHQLSQDMQIRGHRISISGSIGIAFAPEDGSDAETILRHADAAMYAAKHAGKNRCKVYHPGLTADALERVTLLAQLRTAIDNEELDFVLQPKFNARGEVVGAELLARWETALNGVISPGVFVPLAEQNGMAVGLGRLAIRRAADYAACLAAAGRPLPVAVNISAWQVMDDRLGEVLHSACMNAGITPAQLELEVTESIFLQESDAPVQHLTALREQGFPIVMDDFGTGYSSLGYLRRLPFDTIKLDRSFLIDVDLDVKSQRLLTGIVDLCRSLGIGTVAEGVETREQLDLLRRLGVAQYQGYYLARPMSLAAMLKFLPRHAELQETLG